MFDRVLKRLCVMPLLLPVKAFSMNMVLWLSFSKLALREKFGLNTEMC